MGVLYQSELSAQIPTLPCFIFFYKVVRDNMAKLMAVQSVLCDACRHPF